MLLYKFFAPFSLPPNQGAAMSINSIGCTLRMVHVWGKFVTVNCFNSYPALKKLKLFVNVLYTLSSVQCSRSVSNCLPSALINVQPLRVPLSNIWATSEHQVQIRDGTAKTGVTGYFGGFCCQDSQSFGFWVKICGFITMLAFRVKMWLSLHCLRSKGL